MDKFKSIKLVSSPSNPSYEISTSILLSKKPIESSRLFQQSEVRPTQRKSTFSNVALARSGFYSSTSLQESSVRGINRGLGNLPEQRLNKIAKDFINAYGNGNDISSTGLMRIQRQAYEKCRQKPDFNDESVKQLTKAMDQNRDGRVTEDDMLSLCRRYLSCQKRPITYTPTVEQRLAVARRLFKQFDVQKKGYLTEKQVPNLLNETYKTLGKNFSATEQDIKSWMKIADGNGDGQVNLQQYERSIIRALKQQGIRIYQQ